MNEHLYQVGIYVINKIVLFSTFDDNNKQDMNPFN